MLIVGISIPPPLVSPKPSAAQPTLSCLDLFGKGIMRKTDTSEEQAMRGTVGKRNEFVPVIENGLNSSVVGNR